MATPWSYFNKFDDISDKYLPPSGEGDTMATQAVTAVSKIIYKWFNDGDVYDNTHHMEGWANDISSYANWLRKYCEGTQSILDRIETCEDESTYSDILADLADEILDPYYLSELDEQPKTGSVYDCEGPFEFVENYDDDEYDDEYDDDYDEYY